MGATAPHEQVHHPQPAFPPLCLTPEPCHILTPVLPCPGGAAMLLGRAAGSWGVVWPRQPQILLSRRTRVSRRVRGGGLQPGRGCPGAEGQRLTCLGWGEEGEAREAMAWDARAARGEHRAQGLQSGVQCPLQGIRVPPSGLMLLPLWKVLPPLLPPSPTRTSSLNSGSNYLHGPGDAAGTP